MSPDVEAFQPASERLIREADAALHLPKVLGEFLSLSNGLACRSFRLYSVFDPSNPKKTWESLQRANSPSTTEALGGDADLLKRFLVFADIGNGFAYFDRGQGTIWFEERDADSANETSLTLPEFIETMVREAD